MRIESTLNSNNLKNSTLKITTNIREIISGKLVKPLKESRESLDQNYTGGNIGEPSTEIDFTGMINAGTFDDMVNIMDAVISIPEVQNSRFGSVTRPAKQAIKGYRTVRKVIGIYQKLAPKADKLVKIIGLFRNPGYIVDLGKDAIGEGAKLVNQLIKNLIDQGINFVLDYPIVINISKDGLSFPSLERLYDILSKLPENLLALFFNILDDNYNSLLTLIDNIKTYLDVDESTMGEIYKYVKSDPNIPNTVKRSLLDILSKISVDELEEAIRLISMLGLKELFKDLSGAQILGLLKMLSELNETDLKTYLTNLKRLTPEELKASLDSLDVLKDLPTYSSLIKNSINALIRTKDRDYEKYKNELQVSPLVIALKKIDKNYLLEFIEYFNGKLFTERFDVIAYTINGEVKGFEEELINLIKDEITKSSEIEYQMLKIIVLSVYLGVI